jgi:hypothetical protein
MPVGLFAGGDVAIVHCPTCVATRVVRRTDL